MEQNESWFRRHKIWAGILISLFLLFLFVIVAVLNNKKQIAPTINVDPGWESARASDTPQVSDGWAKPLRLAVSEDGMWQDSLFVTRDGSTIYFAYYPGDLFSDLKTGELKSTLVIYSSQKPFDIKTKDSKKDLNDPPWSAGGVYIASDSDIYYHSNRPIPGDNNRYLPHIYKNGDLLPFNNPDIAYDNPHYCAAKDELWFDKDDHEIYILKSAKASGFKGTPILAPKPINSYTSIVQESQPWLSEDCNTLYFTSSRDHFGAGTAIYTSTRINEDDWSEPKVVVKSKIGVGEPTLTADMEKLFFVQILQNSEDQFASNLFYTERE